tara:strand:- start:3744 stop:4511 length:768 start_codon:yes stop_codon:yes gene_type:complete
MLRAVRFASKLKLSIDTNVVQAITANSNLLSNVPAARLFDEFLKLFHSGNSKATFDLLLKYNLFCELFPETEKELSCEKGFLDFIHAALQNSDERVATSKSVTPMFLLGVFLWMPIKRLAEKKIVSEKISLSQALNIAAYEVVSNQQKNISLPKRFTIPMREMLSLQPRFKITRGKRALNFSNHRRFRAAYDFMILLSKVGKVDKSLAKFWTDIQKQSKKEKLISFKINKGFKGKRKSIKTDMKVDIKKSKKNES